MARTPSFARNSMTLISSTCSRSTRPRAISRRTRCSPSPTTTRRVTTYQSTTKLSLSDLEQELLELCAMAVSSGETTTTLHEEMLSEEHDRAVVEATLHGLVARGLMTSSRGVVAGRQRSRGGRIEDRVYEDDWWVVTEEGRAAIGLGPPKPIQYMTPRRPTSNGQQ